MRRNQKVINEKNELEIKSYPKKNKKGKIIDTPKLNAECPSCKGR